MSEVEVMSERREDEGKVGKAYGRGNTLFGTRVREMGMWEDVHVYSAWECGTLSDLIGCK